MTAEELEVAAAAILERAIAAGRLPARPRPEALTLIANIIRPALSGADAAKENDRHHEPVAVVTSGGHVHDQRSS